MPTLSTVFTPEEALSTVANQINKRSEEDGSLIIQKVMPILSVDKPSRKIYTIDPTDEMGRVGNDQDIRPFGEPANVIDYTVTKEVSYDIDKEYSRKRSIPVEVEAAEDEIISEAIDPVELLTTNLLLEREVRGVAKLASELTNVTPSDKFDNPAATVGPITYLRDLADTIRTSGGYRRPNTFACDYTTFKAIVTSAEFISEADKLASVVDDNTPFQRRMILLATLLDFGRNGQVIVSDNGGQKNTAKKGATASTSSIWGENCFLGVADPEISGRTYRGTAACVVWQNPTLIAGQAQDGPFRVLKKYDDDRHANVVQVGMYYDQIAMNAKTGRWITNTLT